MDDKIFDQVHDVDVLYRLCDERYCFPGASGCQRRIKTCTEKGFIFHDRIEQRTG